MYNYPTSRRCIEHNNVTTCLIVFHIQRFEICEERKKSALAHARYDIETLTSHHI